MSEPDQSNLSTPEAALRLLAIRQTQEEIREQVRAEVWSTMRARFRGAVVALSLLSLLVGAVLGAYVGGKRDAAQGNSAGPAPVWGCVTPGTDGGDAHHATEPTPWPIRVYVSGAVQEAQVVLLPPGSLVADALDAVGGAAADADLTALNLAAPLRDHQHIEVPRLSTRLVPATPPPSTAEDNQAATAPDTLVDINTAMIGELETLPGIGPTRAQEIIAFREANGPFETVEDIMDVPGIGPATYAQLAPLITVSTPSPGH